MGWPPQSLDQNIIEKVWDHLPLSKEEPWKSFKKHGERFLMAFLKKLKETISPFSYNMKKWGMDQNLNLWSRQYFTHPFTVNVTAQYLIIILVQYILLTMENTTNDSIFWVHFFQKPQNKF